MKNPRLRIAIDLAKRPRLRALIDELREYTGKRFNTDMIYHVLMHFREEREKRIKFQNENVRLKTQLEYAESLIKKGG